MSRRRVVPMHLLDAERASQLDFHVAPKYAAELMARRTGGDIEEWEVILANDRDLSIGGWQKIPTIVDERSRHHLYPASVLVDYLREEHYDYRDVFEELAGLRLRDEGAATDPVKFVAWLRSVLATGRWDMGGENGSHA